MGVIATLTSSAAHRNTSLRRGTGRVGRDTWRGTLWSPNARSKAQPGSGSLRPTEPLCASPAEPEDAGRPWQKRGSRTRSPMPCAVLPARVALPPSRDTAPPPPPHSPQWTEAPGLLLHHKGSPSGRGLAAGAPSTEDQSGGRPRRQGQGPTPGRPRRTPGMPDPGADEQAGLAQAAGARGVVAGTYLSLRRRRVRVAACRPRGRALEPHTAPLARPRCRTPRARAAAAAHTLGPARGRRGLLNPDRTTAPGRGAQGGPSGSARGRGGPPLPEPRERPSSAAPPRRAAGVPPPTHRSETTLPSPRAMAASGARAPQPAASRHQGTRARPRLNPRGARGPRGRADASRPPGGVPKATCRWFAAPPAPPRTLVTILQALTRPELAVLTQDTLPEKVH